MAEFCLNVCELLNGTMLRDGKLDTVAEMAAAQEAEWRPGTKRPGMESPGTERHEVKRIYAGSAFCSQYFLHINWWELLLAECRNRRWNLTLTLPVFSQKDLKRGKERIREILAQGSDVIDEITVNDVGMLYYISGEWNGKINLGRLFFKDARDIRVREYDERTVTPNLLASWESHPLGDVQIHGIELDRVSRRIDLTGCPLPGVILGVHSPFCYMSTGNICKFASIHKEMKYKFRPNTSCAMECAGIYEHYRSKFDGKDADIIRFGRTIYYLKNDCEVIGKEVGRDIYFPVRETEKVAREGGKS